MDIEVFLGILCGCIVLCLGIISITVMRKLGTQTDTLINIMSSFAGINTNLKVIITKLEDYDKNTSKRAEGQKEIIIVSLKNVSDRMEKLENGNKGQIAKMDNDLNRLYMHCSRKIERDSLIKDD